MAYTKRASKTDDNQSGIVDELRKLGCSVAVTSGAGDGFPDLLVGCKCINWPYKVNILMEVKDGSKSPSRRRLTKDQQEFHDDWQGPIHIVCSVEDAVLLVIDYQMGRLETD